MIEFTLLNTMLMLLATPGMIAPAATATKPAISAYSMRSWPRLSFQILIFRTASVIVRIPPCMPHFPLAVNRANVLNFCTTFLIPEAGGE